MNIINAAKSSTNCDIGPKVVHDLDIFPGEDARVVLLAPEYGFKCWFGKPRRIGQATNQVPHDANRIN